MSSTEKLLASIEKSNLVSSEVIARLRQKLEKSPDKIHLKAVVKWLVDKGHVTPAQGKRLLAGEAPAPAAGRPGAPSRPAGPEDELELLPLDDAGPARAVPPPMPPLKEEDELVPLDDEPAVRTPSPPRRAAKRPPVAKTTRSEKRPKPAASAGHSPAAGGLDDLFGGLPASQAGLSAGAASMPGRTSKLGGRRPEQGDRSVWDSPLLLVAGGLLLLLVFLGVFLYWRITRETGDQALAAAQADYKGGSYTQAINKFEEYLKDYPGHAGVSAARVQLGMARMRQAVEGSRDWPKALRAAKDILAEIAKENEFSQARPELAALLPAIAEGLALEAAQKSDPALVKQSREALALVAKYVPKTLTPNQKLLDIEASLTNTDLKLNRGAALEIAVAQIKQESEAGKTADAYQTRKQLLKTYPELADDEALQAAVASISQAEREAVRFADEPRPAEMAEAASPVVASLVLASRNSGTAPGVTGEVVLVLARGAAYGLDAATGAVLWRRFVGFDTDFAPRPVYPEAGSDVLLVDSRANQVLRVGGKTGQLRWRAAVGETFDAHPVLLRKQLLVATRAGRLVTLDLETGDSAGYVRLPQGLSVGPAVDSRERLYYQLGEHSNLFVLSPAQRRCREVFYLGHAPDSIRVPPLVVSRYLIVAENNTADDAVLRVLLADENGLGLRQVHEWQLKGHVLTPLEAAGRTLFVATDRGALYSFELSAPGEGEPLARPAAKPPEDEPPLVRFPLFGGAQVWIAGTDLTKYDIQAAQGRLSPKWVKYEGDAFLGPPRRIGGVIYHVRQKGQLPGVLASAILADTGEPLWETHLAAPPAGEPVVDAAGKVTVMNAAGALFEVAAGGLGGHAVQDTATAAPAAPEPFAPGGGPVVLEGGRLALAPGPGQPRVLVAEPAGSPRLHWLALPDALAATPISFRGGLLVPGQVGQVFVLDPASGREMIAPFQPRLEAGVQFPWSRPTRLGDNEVLVADGRTKLYRLGVAEPAAGGPPHLVKLAQADLAGPGVSPIAALDRVAYAVDAAGRLLSFRLPELKPGKEWPLGGPSVWGPERVGAHILVTTETDEVCCLDDQEQLLWRVPLPYGRLAGAPLAARDGFVLASLGGIVYRVAGDSGQEAAKLDLGQPLATGPVALGDRLLLSGHDGTLHLVPRP